MRRTMLIQFMCMFMLASCAGWTGAALNTPHENDQYAKYVDTKPVVIAGILPVMALPFSYSVEDCFSDISTVSTVKDMPGLVVGDDPIDLVCTQYAGVDLRKYPSEAIDCFSVDQTKRMGGGTTVPAYLHPWLSENSSPVCAQLVVDINLGRTGASK